MAEYNRLKHGQPVPVNYFTVDAFLTFFGKTLLIDGVESLLRHLEGYSDQLDIPYFMVENPYRGGEALEPVFHLTVLREVIVHTPGNW